MSENKSPRLSSAAGILTGATILILSSGVHAETGRYTMTPTKDGVLKLDTRTGSLSLCSRLAGSWQCKRVDSNDPAKGDRVKELELENSRLRARLEQRRYDTAPNEGGKLEMPSEEDVDKAMDFMEKLLRRFKGMAEDLKKGKTDENGVPL